MKKVPCEVFSRVCGYFRPIKSWNDGKRSEFEDRKAFSECACTKHELFIKEVPA